VTPTKSTKPAKTPNATSVGFNFMSFSSDALVVTSSLFPKHPKR
jgi:hypothetical protein